MPHTEAVFAGRLPDLYDRLMGPVYFEPYAAEIARRLGWLDGGTLLEIAAGTGIVTAALMRALPEAVGITATDLAEPMLAAARAKLPPGRVTLRQADAQALPFADRAFDAVVCSFGMMFPKDKPAAYAEALRVLRPGGRFLFTVWSDLAANPVPEVVQEAVAALFPDDPPLFMARIPHGYHDADAILAAVEGAGFEGVRTERVVLPCRNASARHAAAAICQGTPLSAEIEARRGPGLDAVTEAAARRLAERLGDGSPDGEVIAPMEAIFVSGRRPG